MSQPKELKLTLDESLVNEIVTAVSTTLTSIAGMKPEKQAHQFSRDHEILGDVSGLITLMQDSAEGTLVVSFPKETICAILTKLYRKPFGEINSSVKSGVGELTNMIYGVLKNSLNKKGHALKMSLPNVILGEQHTVIQCGNGPALIVPFLTPAGSFTVNLVLAQDFAKTSQAAA